MSRTLTRQTRPDFTSLQTQDGNPEHSHLAHDLVYGLNNLTYCSPYMGMCFSPGKWFDGSYSGPAILEQNAATSGESFIAQVPAILPRDAVRFCWTLGIRHNVTAAEFGRVTYAHPVSIDDVTVYISPTPYTGRQLSTTSAMAYAGDGTGLEAADTFFDTSKLGVGYGMSRYATPISCTASVEEYKFVDMSAGTSPITAWMPFENPTNLDSILNRVFLIITITRHSTDSAALNAPGLGAADGEKIKLNDFTWWVAYE